MRIHTFWSLTLCALGCLSTLFTFAQDSLKHNNSTESLQLTAPGQQSADRALEVLNLDDIKRALVYPEILKAMQVQGKVMVRAFVDQNGKLVKHEFVKSPHELFNKEIEKHIHALKFSPATKDHAPIESELVIPFYFRLGKPNPGENRKFVCKIAP